MEYINILNTNLCSFQISYSLFSFSVISYHFACDYRDLDWTQYIAVCNFGLELGLKLDEVTLPIERVCNVFV